MARSKKGCGPSGKTESNLLSRSGGRKVLWSRLDHVICGKGFPRLLGKTTSRRVTRTPNRFKNKDRENKKNLPFQVFIKYTDKLTDKLK